MLTWIQHNDAISYTVQDDTEAHNIKVLISEDNNNTNYANTVLDAIRDTGIHPMVDEFSWAVDEDGNNYVSLFGIDRDHVGIESIIATLSTKLAEIKPVKHTWTEEAYKDIADEQGITIQEAKQYCEMCDDLERRAEYTDNIIQFPR